MKLSALIVARPIFVFIFLTLLVLLLPSLVISFWYKITRQIEKNVYLNTQDLYSGLQSEIETISTLVYPLNSSTTNLARFLTSSINQTQISSFDQIETKVAPILFQALSTIPYISQISYVGLEGLLFSYYIDGNETLAVYANTSSPFNSSSVKERKKYFWYKQYVDQYSGKLYGDVVKSHSLNLTNTSWFQAALNHSEGYSCVEKGWNINASDPMFLNSASIEGNGVVSLAFPVERFTDIVAGIDLYGGSLSLATMDGKMLIDGIRNATFIYVNNSIVLELTRPDGDQVDYAQNFTCKPRNDHKNVWYIGDKKYSVHCSPIEVSGVQLVYALALPHEGIVSLVLRNSKLSLILLVVMIIMVTISIFSFVLLMVRSAEREMCLHAKLIKQMEATQQAERKSINKSNALAGASHDIRASLAGITGLIDICLNYATSRSDYENHLKQMHNCAQDLLGLLNSILDASKIEAGMMNLEEETFNLAELLENVVDLYHPVGMRKGVDVVLDPCDGSIIKFSLVKGDRGKLMQVLSNLLSNAVKFTPEGHVSMRAWAVKPNFDSTILASGQKGLHKYLPCLFFNNNEARNDMEVISAVRQSPDSMEFVFEVDDTGKGIPKEKHKSVFENFVQVKETAAGQVGTGLGLGIVQSLVRLMGGEIGIVDKETGEKGTCFRFNVFLATCETSSLSNRKGENEPQGAPPMPGGSQQHPGLTIHTPSPSLNICSMSPKLAIRTQSPKSEGSQVVLLIQSDGRQRMLQKFLERLGISVLVVDQRLSLYTAFEKIKSKLSSSHHSSRRSDLSCRSDISSTSSKEMPLSTMDGREHKLSLNKRRGVPNFVLLVADANALGSFSELWGEVARFRRGLHGICCKVVWLVGPASRSINSVRLERERLDPGDEILSQPFHGSRLYQVIKLLPEFGGTLSQGISANQESSSSQREHSYVTAKPTNRLHNQEIQEDGSSSDGTYESTLVRTRHRLNLEMSPMHQFGQMEKKTDHIQSSSKQQPLSGKRVLIAEDTFVLSHIETAIVKRLGGNVENCENGEEALQLVRNGLKDQRNGGGQYILPYDYILMDYEMPIMNGEEATRQIRKEEKDYGVHIPIIALTAHTSGPEARKALEAGMDAHLGKPLTAEKLMETIENIHSKGKYV